MMSMYLTILLTKIQKRKIVLLSKKLRMNQNCKTAIIVVNNIKKIARHLTDIHSDEVEVAKALAFPIRITVSAICIFI